MEEIETLSDFFERVKSLKKDKHYEYFFRGHNEIIKIGEITPSIYRRINNKNKRTYIIFEDEMFMEIVRKKPQDFIDEKTVLEKLVKMSHYFLPTRLLDITSNPLVALYFACQNPMYRPNVNGEVVLFKIPKTDIISYDGDTASLISNLSLMPYNFPYKDKDLGYLNYEIIKERPAFDLDERGKRDLYKVFAVKVKLNNERINRQNGSFLIFGMRIGKVLSPPVPPSWINEHLPITIFNGRKKSLLEELDALNINLSTLFPELEYETKYTIETIAKRNYIPKFTTQI